MYLPMKYQDENGTRVCAQCGAKFAIPEEDVTEYVDVCEECGPKLEAQYAVQEANQAKSDEAATAVDKALGK